MAEVLLIEPMYSEGQQGSKLLRRGAVFTSGSSLYTREPIAAEYIAGYLRFRGVSADAVQQTQQGNGQLLELIDAERPRIVGVSVHSTHILPDVMDLLDGIKAGFPNVVTVCGGAHPTGSPEMAAERSVDYVIVGEGEEATYLLYRAVAGGRDPKGESIPGLAYRDAKGGVHSLPARRFDFTQRFRPVRKAEILERVKSAPLSYPAPDGQRGAAQVAYSRGCPHVCSFCISPKVFPGRVIWRDPDDVVEELRELKGEYGTNFVFFNDLTFNHDPRKARELSERLIEAKLGISWFAYTDTNLGEGLARTMAEAGCTRIGVGAESLSDETLKEIKPQQDVAKIRRTLELADRYGILTRVYFMIGAPGETEEDLTAMAEAMRSLPIDQPRIGFMVPLPGTDFHERTKGMLVTDDARKFTGDYPVIGNPDIAPERYLELRDSMFRGYHNSDEYLEHVRAKCASHPHLSHSFAYFLSHLRERGVLGDQSYSKAVAMGFGEVRRTGNGNAAGGRLDRLRS